MPLTNLNLPSGYVGPGSFVFPVSTNPGGAVIYVNSATGLDSRSRLQGWNTANSAASSSTNTQGPYGDPNNPLATVFGTNGALSYVKAGRGDLIIVQPSHTEAIGGAVVVPANVTILGLGYNASRPLFTLNTAITANVLMSGAGSQLNNLVFAATGFAAITSVITVTGAGCQIVNTKVVQGNATNQAVTGITVGAADLTIGDSEIHSTLATGAVQGLLSSAAVARLKILNCNIVGDFSAACLKSASTNHITEMLVSNCQLVQRNGTAKCVINFTTSSTGIICNNQFNGTTWSSAADAITNSTSVQLRWFQNYGFDDGAGAVSAILCPAAGTIS